MPTNKKQTYTNDGAKTNTNTTTKVDNNKVVRDTTNTSNLAGTNNIKNSVGTAKGQPATKSNVLSGTPNKNVETGKTFIPSSSSGKDTTSVARQNLSKVQNTLSSMADSSNKKAQQFLGAITNTISSIANEGKKNADYQAQLRQDKFARLNQKSFSLGDQRREELKNSTTEQDLSMFFNQDGSEIDYAPKLKELNTRLQTYENISMNATDEMQKASADTEIAKIQSDIDYYNNLVNKRDAFKESSILQQLQESGDEEAEYNYRKTLSHKDDSLLQRFGSAGAHLIATTLNEIPLAMDEIKLGGQTYVAKDNLNRLEVLHNNNEIDDDTYAEALKYWQDEIDNYRAQYNDSISQELQKVVEQYSAETFYNAKDVEKFVLQAGESTAQFLLHYAIGAGIAGATTSLAGEAFRQTAGAIATGTMSTMSATTKMDQLLKEGYDVETSAMNGLFTGLVSYAVEKVGMDRFVEMLGTDVSVNIIGDILLQNTKSGVAEGLEEVVEGLIDPYIDSITLGTDYHVNGNELKMEFLLGGASGLMMGFGANVGSLARTQVEINNYLQGRQAIRSDIVERTGQLVVEDRRQYDLLQAEVDALRNYLPSMTTHQQEVARELITKGANALNVFSNRSQLMGVTLSSDFIAQPTFDESSKAVYTALTPDVNKEIQARRQIDELQTRVNEGIDNVIARDNVRLEEVQQMLNDNGYDISADVFTSLNPQAQQQALVALDTARALGINASITNDLPDGVNGYVDHNGFIVVDGNKRPILSTLSHELTHGTENSQYYDALKKIVKRAYGDNWNNVVNQKIQDYSQVQDLDFEGAEKEVVARYVEDKLGDEQFMNDLIKYNYSLASKIWQDLKAIGNDDEIVQIRNAFEKAFSDKYLQNNSQQSFDGDNVYAVDGKTYKMYKGNDVPYNTNTSNEVTKIKSSDLDKASIIIENAKNGDKSFSSNLKQAFKSVIENLRGTRIEITNVKNSDGSPYYVDVFKSMAGKLSSSFSEEIEYPNEIIAILNNLEPVLKKAYYYASAEFDNHNNINNNDAQIKRYDYLHSDVEVDKEPYIVQFDVEVSNKTNRLRTYDIKKITLMGSNGGLVELVAPENPSGTLKVSYDPQNVNTDAKANLENFLTSDDVINAFGLLDGYTGANSNVDNLDTDINYSNKTREETIQNNLDSLYEAMDNELNSFLEEYEITQDELPNYRSELASWISDPYDIIEGSPLEELSFEQRDKFGELVADYLIEKYSPNIYQTGNPNVRFSLGDNYREDGSRKDLRAIHNLSATELEQSLNLGGFAMPSIAVTKDSINHSGYGDISIVFDKDTIDPSRKENEVFGGDAYTSRFPALEYNIDATDEMLRLYDIEKEYGLSGLGVRYDSSNLETIFNESKNLDEAKRRLSNNNSTRLLFLDSLDMLDKAIIKESPQVALDSGLVKALVDAKAEEYNEFVDNLVNKIVKGSGLRNNQDIYTPSGSRRSFESLHEEYNLENALRLMLDASRGGSRNVETGFGGVGVNAMIASQTQSFKDINDIIKNEDRLQDLSYEEFSKVRDELSDSIRNDIDNFIEKTGIYPRFNYIEASDLAENLALEFLNAKTESKALKIAEEYYTGNATKEQIIDFYKTIQKYKEPMSKMPAFYFEAKPRRIVGINEWKQAYVPDSTSEELKQRLRDSGVEVIEYQNNGEDGRPIAMNQNAQRYQFSLDDSQNVDPNLQEGLDANQEAIDKYGAYDLGNKPVRELQIARATDDGPISRFINNLVNSNYVSDEEATKIQSQFKELGSYEKTSNEKQINEARKMIREKGLEESFKYAMNSDSMATIDVDNVFLAELINEFRLKGLEGTEAYYQLIAREDWRSSMSGKALQSFNIYRTQSPRGQIITIRSEIERIQEGLNERFGEGAYNVELDEGLIEEYLRARTQEERDAIRERIAIQVADQIPPTIMEQLNSWRHLSMLFNPRTWIKNAGANFVHGYINEVTRAMRSVVEGIAHQRDSSVQRQAGIYNPFSSEDKANYDRAIQDYNANFSGKMSKYNNYDLLEGLTNTDFGKQVMDNRKQFTWNFLNQLSDFNSRRMSDRPAVSKAYAKTLVGYLKVNNLTFDTITSEQMQQAREFALNEALYATFNTDNWLANQITNFERQADKVSPRVGSATRMIVESFVPFKRTPFNILKTGFNYSPVGLAKTLTANLYDLKKGKITATNFIDNMCQGLTGTGIVMLGALLSNLGIFRTKDDDKDRKKYLDRDNGEQDYSINWEGGSYTIDWLDPLIIPLAMGAEIQKLTLDGSMSLEDFRALATAMAEPIFETSMMSGITNNLKSYASDSTGYTTDLIGNALTNYASQYIPTIMGALARTIDDTRRRTYPNEGGIDKLKKQTMNKIPGLSMLNDPYINRQGQEQKNEDLGMGMVGRAVLNFLSPGYYADKDIDEYDEELYRLYNETGELDSLPSNSTKNLTYENEKYNFTPEQYTEWHKTRWQTETEYVNDFIDSQAYSRLSDDERVATIKDIRSYAQKVAKKQFLESQGIEYDDKQLNNAQGAIDNGIELYNYFDYLNNAGTKQAEKVKYLEESGLSQQQKEYLWSLNDYKKSYEDVYKKVFSGESNSSSKKKSSSKSSKSGSSGKSSKTKKISTSGAGSGGKISKAGKLASPSRIVANPNKEQQANIVNSYLKAYSNNMRQGRASTSSASAQVVCYNCGNRVSPVNGRCPVCGVSL